jgi:predicted outer membrane repeat protein
MARINAYIQLAILLMLVLLIPACTSSDDQVTEYNPGCFVNNLIGHIGLANADPVPAIINLAEDCEYNLTVLNNTYLQNISSGLPVISNDITINGNNATISIPSGPQYYFGHFAVAPEGYLQLYDVTLRGGYRIFGGAIYNHQGRVYAARTAIIENTSYSDEGGPLSGGGAIYNREGIISIVDNSVISDNTTSLSSGLGGAIVNDHGRLLVSDSELSGNYAGKEGGAIYNLNGYLSITDSDLLNNEGGEKGGAIAISRTDPQLGHEGVEVWGSSFSGNEAADGGAIYATGEITPFYITTTVFSSNTATHRGGAFTLKSSILTINASTFTGNHSIDCGAIENSSDSNLTVTGSLFQSNRADLVGGGICHIWGDMEISDSDFLENQAGNYGGGLVVSDPITILTSTFDQNSAGDGGGLYIWEMPSQFYTTGEGDPVVGITDSTIQNNTADLNGGGIAASGELTIERSTIFNNTAPQGGAIYAASGILNLTNSTISANYATTNGAGVLTTSLVDANIVHCTIAYNRAPLTGGGVITSGDVNLHNTIVAHNLPSDCSLPIGGGTVSFEGDNLDTDGSCDGFTFSSYDPQLERLSDNGGHTQTHALRASSIAIDRNNECANVGEDQRMVSRPQGADCDLGAYERQETEPPPPPPPPPPVPFLLQTTTEVNCRIGPHFDHVRVITFTTGHTANAIGRNEDGSWLAVAVPEELGEVQEPWCWLPDAFVQRESDPHDLPELDHLPSPDRLEPKEPTKEPGEPEEEEEPGCGTVGCP